MLTLSMEEPISTPVSNGVEKSKLFKEIFSENAVEADLEQETYKDPNVEETEEDLEKFVFSPRSPQVSPTDEVKSPVLTEQKKVGFSEVNKVHRFIPHARGKSSTHNALRRKCENTSKLY